MEDEFCEEPTHIFSMADMTKNANRVHFQKASNVEKQPLLYLAHSENAFLVRQWTDSKVA